MESRTHCMFVREQSRYMTLCVCVCVLGVKGEDALVVSSHQQQWWEVFGQSFQPAHVEGARHCALSCQRHAPSHTQREKEKFNFYDIYIYQNQTQSSVRKKTA